MDYIIDFLNFFGISDNKYNQCDLFDGDGKGIIIDDYIFTLSHVMEDNKNIYHKDNMYKILLNIEVYDICILTKNLLQDTDIQISKFINLLENYMEKNISLKNFSNYNNTDFKIYDKDIILQLKNIQNIHLKSFIYPPIPLYQLKFKNDYKDEEINFICNSGISGSILYNEYGCIGLITSLKKLEQIIEAIPFEIILDIIKSYIKNNLFNYLPIVLNNNVVKNYNNIITDNDYILKINNNELKNNMIYITKFNFSIDYQTYILLYCNDYVTIKYVKNKQKKIKTINIDLLNYDFINIKFNFKNNDNNAIIKNFIFKELSEEYLLINIHKNIPDIDYDDIYKTKKMIYLESINSISNDKLDKKNNLDNIDFDNNVYILNKISGHKIYTLNNINKYKTNNQIIIELIDPFNRKIKIKI